MRHPQRILVTFAALAALATPASALAQPSSPAAPTVTVARVPGAEAIAIAGSASPARSLGVTLTARFSEDLPDVVLNRRTVTTDAGGRFALTMPTAPAFFRGALVFAEVRVLPDGGVARASLPVGPPNVPAPPDDIPSTVR